jgi:RNA polymerase sigma-70 factor, ECF subfamily
MVPWASSISERSIMSDRVEKSSDELLARWRGGDQQAATELFRRYTDRLVNLARHRLSAKFARRVDPEDVVQSVYRSLLAIVHDDRYDLRRGGDLWNLLVGITLHKLQHQVQRLSTRKRDINREQGFGSEDSLIGIEAVAALARDPSPVEALTLADELQHVMGELEPLPRRIFELRLQGYDLNEIATEVGRSQRTVSRALERAKELLQERHCKACEAKPRTGSGS